MLYDILKKMFLNIFKKIIYFDILNRENLINSIICIVEKKKNVKYIKKYEKLDINNLFIN
jgi:hypothetical protein